jgi:hypothetical protein
MGRYGDAGHGAPLGVEHGAGDAAEGLLSGRGEREAEGSHEDDGGCDELEDR